MTNLFIDTSFRLSEEDRLTNALMALFEHSDQRVLEEFLALCGENKRELSSDFPPRFKLQPTFDASRPDARITLPDLDIVIETKRDDSLDRGQFRRHWQHIVEHTTGPTLLVALTNSHATPSIVTELSLASTDERCDTRHVSWSDWLGVVVTLQENFAAETSTGLLLRQFEEYLRSLGYWYFDGPPVDRITDFGVTLRKYWGPHRERTQPYVQERMSSLMRSIDEQMAGRDGWSFNLWGKAGCSHHRSCGIARFDCALKEFDTLTRFRVSLALLSSGELALYYYLTIRHASDHFEEVGSEMLARRETLDHFEPFDRYGFRNSHRLFHCRKRAALELVHGFLNGNDADEDLIAAEISAFFTALDAELATISATLAT